MSANMDDFLNHVDQWKAGLQEKLSRMTLSQRKAFWRQIHEEAGKSGLPVVESEKPAKQ